MTGQQTYLNISRPDAGVTAMDRNVCEGKLVEMEQKIASLQRLIAELLATNQQLREQSKSRD